MTNSHFVIKMINGISNSNTGKAYCSAVGLPQSIFDKMTENRSYNVIQLDNNVANNASSCSVSGVRIP